MAPETMGLLAAIGIEKRKPFAPDARMTKILSCSCSRSSSRGFMDAGGG